MHLRDAVVQALGGEGDGHHEDEVEEELEGGRAAVVLARVPAHERRSADQQDRSPRRLAAYMRASACASTASALGDSAAAT